MAVSTPRRSTKPSTGQLNPSHLRLLKLSNWSLVNFSKFDPSTLADINDLQFDTLGKNNKKFRSHS